MDKILFLRQHHKQAIIKRLVYVSGLLLLLQFTSISSLFAQTVKLSLNKENATFEEVFKEIEAKTGYKFVYNTSDINRNDRVSIQETNQSLDEILRNMLRSKRDISFTA